MNPQGTALTPQPTTTSPQGVASVTPNAAPVAPTLPASPQIAATPAPVATPDFNTSQALSDIGNYYQIPRQTAATAGAGQAQGAVAQQQFEAQKYQNQIKIQNQKDSLDPSKYQFSKNSDGSVSILNSTGDKVDIGTYSALTGGNPAEALQKAGATDKASEQFIQAYNNFQTFAQAKIASANGDEQATVQLGEFYKNNPGLQNLELGQIQSAFMKQYGQYFGQPQGDQQASAQAGANPTIASRNSYTASSPYYASQAYNLTGETNPYAAQTLGANGGNPSSVSSILGQAVNPSTGV